MNRPSCSLKVKQRESTDFAITKIDLRPFLLKIAPRINSECTDNLVVWSALRPEGLRRRVSFPDGVGTPPCRQENSLACWHNQMQISTHGSALLIFAPRDAGEWDGGANAPCLLVRGARVPSIGGHRLSFSNA